MLRITEQYTSVRYTKLVNKVGTAVAKVITFSIMTTCNKRVTYTQYDMPPRPTPAEITLDISNAELEWLPCDQHAPQYAE